MDSVLKLALVSQDCGLMVDHVFLAQRIVNLAPMPLTAQLVLLALKQLLFLSEQVKILLAVLRFVVMELDSLILAMTEILKMVMDVMNTARLKQDGIVMEEDLQEEITASKQFLNTLS